MGIPWIQDEKNIRTLKLGMITQMSSASISLAASMVIVAFIAFGKDPTATTYATTTNARRNGRRRRRRAQRHRRRERPPHQRPRQQQHPLRQGRSAAQPRSRFQTIRERFYNPYRRLIFGLSIADIFLSFAILTGPFMVRSDIPQALWGLGNVSTCNINGFLALLGMTAVPMYTLSLCIYYVCKIKGKMTDEQFATKIEKKMHISIIVFNIFIYLTAMGMGAINPGVTGSVCSAAAYPTGCRQYPEDFGECDSFIAEASHIFIIISSIVVPTLCLAGVIGCMAVLFWHVLMMDQIFGRQSSRTGRTSTRGATPNRMRSTRLARNIPLSAGRSTSNFAISSFTISQNKERSDLEEPSIDENDHNDGTSNHNETPNKKKPSDYQDESHVSAEVSISTSNHEIQEDAQLPQQQPLDPEIGISTSNHEIQEDAQVPQQEPPDPQIISRLYKRELVTQACCYVAVFCSTILIYSTINITLILGGRPSNFLAFITTSLYPLGGFFNILVYTRPNVASFLRKCPECSWCEAFWLVLKEGGEMPDENEWQDARQQRRRPCCRISCLSSASTKRGEEGQNNIGDPGGRDDDALGDSSAVSQANVNEVHAPDQEEEETISYLQFGMPSQPPAPYEILPDSNLGINGLSQSIDSDNIAHRVIEDWSYIEGEGARMMAIEEDDESSGALAKSSEILVSEGHAVDVLSTLSSSASQREEKRKKEDFDAMWEATFDRVRKYEEGKD